MHTHARILGLYKSHASESEFVWSAERFVWFVLCIVSCLGDLQQHLQTMFTLLRPEDNIRLVNDAFL